MSEEELKLLDLIYEGRLTYNELVCELNTDRETLNRYLRDLKLRGKDWYKKYYSDGSTRIAMPDYTDYEEDSTAIITRPDENVFKALIVSDLHLGCTIERLDLLYRAFEYAKEKRIHIIFGCGDLLDGAQDRSAAQSTIPDTFKQIEYIIEKYPHDKNILTFAVLGNHEGYASRRDSVDIAQTITNARSDLIISDLPYFCIGVKNEVIKLKHKLETTGQERVNIFGHTHKYLNAVATDVNSYNTIENVRVFDKSIVIKAPSLSNANQGVPSMMEMRLYFTDGYIYKIYTSEIGFIGRNSVRTELIRSTHEILLPELDVGPIRNVEDYRHEEIPKRYRKIL